MQIKKRIERLIESTNEFDSEYITYNAETLRIILEKTLDYIKTKDQECEKLKQWKKGAENLFKAQIDNADKIVNRYKQALDEIEKQAKAMNNECFYDDTCDCNNCDMKNGCSYYRKFKILKIINKAKKSK